MQRQKGRDWMSPDSNQTSLKQSLSLRVFYVSTALSRIEQRLQSDIRQQGYRLLRQGVTAVVKSFLNWQNRQAY